jgi:hypothetical protein
LTLSGCRSQNLSDHGVVEVAGLDLYIAMDRFLADLSACCFHENIEKCWTSLGEHDLANARGFRESLFLRATVGPDGLQSATSGNVYSTKTDQKSFTELWNLLFDHLFRKNDPNNANE